MIDIVHVEIPWYRNCNMNILDMNTWIWIWTWTSWTWTHEYEYEHEHEHERFKWHGYTLAETCTWIYLGKWHDDYMGLTRTCWHGYSWHFVQARYSYFIINLVVKITKHGANMGEIDSENWESVS